MDAMRPVHVALPVPLWQEFTYLAPKTIPIGAIVQVSFGSRMLWGIVWKDVPPCSAAMKPIACIHPFFQISPALMSLMDAVARYVICPLGLIVKMVIPPAIAYAEIENLTASPGHSATPSEWDPLYQGTVRQWASHQGVSLVSARAWVRSGMLSPCPNLPIHLPDPIEFKQLLILSPEQSSALDQLEQKRRECSTIVLEGVTGSGKTEVLLALCQSIWSRGQQVLVLLPEIMLSYPWLQRVEKYFNVPSTLWHSAMSPRMRQEGFENIIMGRTMLTIGARSALFLPYADLGLIIVDEEHESAYKQTDGVFYHGRDMAVLRGKKENIPVVLASATPSMETRWNIRQNRYAHVRIHHRYGVAQMPAFSCIDMTPHPPQDNAWISPALRGYIQETLDKGEQSLLFLNRRGYACLWMCYRCGYRAACAHCSAWLTVHQTPPQLLCHYCGYQKPMPTQCPGCSDDQGMLLMGPGIERIAAEVRHLFPNARTALLSSDHVTSTNQMKSVLDQIANREIDILIGTQLIAKGYHFPYLTCIGIVDTDFALADMDFRAGERLFQLLYQVAGRAGRADRPGRVFLQTMQPHYPMFRQIFSYDWDSFADQELQMRQNQDSPPVTRFTSVILSHRQEWQVQDFAMRLQKTCPKYRDIQVFGPAPAPLNPLRGRYRWRFLIKAPLSASLYTMLMQWLYKEPLPKGILVEVDRDPYSLL
jgi:primosomal protein N' (replication factor Y)